MSINGCVTLKYKIQGSYPPFGVELRCCTTGQIINTYVAPSANTTYCFTCAPGSGDFEVKVYDNAFGHNHDNISYTTSTTSTSTTSTSTTSTSTTTAAPTTTTTTTVAAPTTTTTTTTLAPTTTTTTTTIASQPCPVHASCTYSTLNSYHLYPAFIVDFGTATGTVTSSIIPYGTPNRFNIYTVAGALVCASPWVGCATYSGPWGTASAGSPYTCCIGGTTLTLNLAAQCYKFTVETTTGPTDTDNWEWDIPCPPAPALYASVCMTFNSNPVTMPYQRFLSSLTAGLPYTMCITQANVDGFSSSCTNCASAHMCSDCIVYTAGQFGGKCIGANCAAGSGSWVGACYYSYVAGTPVFCIPGIGSWSPASCGASHLFICSSCCICLTAYFPSTYTHL